MISNPEHRQTIQQPIVQQQPEAIQQPSMIRTAEFQRITMSELTLSEYKALAAYRPRKCKHTSGVRTHVQISPLNIEI